MLICYSRNKNSQYVIKKNITLNFKENDDNFEPDIYSQSIKRSNLLSFVNSLNNRMKQFWENLDHQFLVVKDKNRNC